MTSNYRLLVSLPYYLHTKTYSPLHSRNTVLPVNPSRIFKYLFVIIPVFNLTSTLCFFTKFYWIYKVKIRTVPFSNLR